MHLKQTQQSNSMPGHFNPDVFQSSNTCSLLHQTSSIATTPYNIAEHDTIWHWLHSHAALPKYHKHEVTKSTGVVSFLHALILLLLYKFLLTCLFLQSQWHIPLVLYIQQWLQCDERFKKECQKTTIKFLVKVHLDFSIL